MANPVLSKQFFADNEKVTVGDHTYGQPLVIGRGFVRIGRYCSMAEGVRLYPLGDHHTEWVTTYPFHQIDYWQVKKAYPPGTKRGHNIIIGNDVWIGKDAVVMHGVTIGDGVVIGSQAVVAKDIRPYAVVVGNPAEEIKRRFDDETIEALLEIRWWDWADEIVKENIGLLLDSPDLEELWKVADSLSVDAQEAVTH